MPIASNRPRPVAVVQILHVADEVVAIAREQALTSILSLNAPTFALSIGQQPQDELLGRLPQQPEVSVMLPLVSSITTTVIG